MAGVLGGVVRFEGGRSDSEQDRAEILLGTNVRPNPGMRVKIRQGLMQEGLGTILSVRTLFSRYSRLA